MADTAMTIGEKLEEARKRRGISIREAAEATKVRGDYLLAMENNSFEINLPEIYIRGFLRIYVNYLRLDLEKLMAEYDSTKATLRKGQKPHIAPARRDPQPIPHPQTPPAAAPAPRTSFGRMEISRGDSADPQAAQQMSFAPGEVPEGAGIPWLKPVLLASAALVTLLVVGLVIYAIAGRVQKPEINPELATAQAPAVRPITLIASEPVTVWVIRKSDNTRVFEGTLAAGETKVIDVAGQVELRFNKGRALMIERDGRRQRIGVDGTGRTIFE